MWAIESRRTNDARARSERRKQYSNQSVDMEQRHHIETSIARCQIERRDYIVDRRRQIGLRQRHHLRPRRRARRKQYQRFVFGLREDRHKFRRGGLEIEREYSCRIVELRFEPNHADAARAGYFVRRRVGTFLDNQRLRFERGKIVLKFAAPIERIERSARRTRHHRE